MLNKVDVPEAKELADFVRPDFERMGLKVFEISTASHEGLKELNFALAAMVADMRQEVASREQAEEEARVVINPLENRSNRRRAAANGTADFAVAQGGRWRFLVRGDRREARTLGGADQFRQ